MNKALTAALALLLCTSAYAQSAGETALAFRKFESRLRAGTSYERYVEALGDLEFAASEYEADKGSDKGKSEVFNRALGKYKVAGNAWQVYMAAVRGNYVTDSAYKISTTYCPGVPIHKDIGIGACLRQNWTEATDLLKSIQ